MKYPVFRKRLVARTRFPGSYIPNFAPVSGHLLQNPTTLLTDLSLDAQDFEALIACCEDEFGVDISVLDTIDLVTSGDLFHCVLGKISVEA